ncbi:MAG TPA: WD40 repeat domain-containing protein [bacterium]|nr:WD40 repeat domain-containing protein [bacterium]
MLPDLNYKRIFLAILLVVISLALIFGIVWLIFIRQGANINQQATNTGQYEGGLPSAGQGGEGNISEGGGRLPQSAGGQVGEMGLGPEEEAQAVEVNEVAKGSFTKANGLSAGTEIKSMSREADSFNFLSAEDDKFYRIYLNNGQKTVLSEEEFPFVEEVTWAPGGQKVVLQYPDGAVITYDFTTGKKTTLPTGAEDFSFSQSAESVAYKYVTDNEEDNWLVVSDAATTKSEAIEPIGDQGDKVIVDWSPNNQVVAIYRKPIGLEQEELFFIGLSGENFKSLKVGGSNFEGIWSPKGDKILYSVLTAGSQYNPTLWVADAVGDSIGNNNFALGLITWASKCVFAKDGLNVYCAVPVNLPQAAGLYPELVNESPDVIYQINLATGIKKMLAYPVLSQELEQFQIRQLFISDDSRKLYFWDNFTSEIYYIRLK